MFLLIKLRLSTKNHNAMSQSEPQKVPLRVQEYFDVDNTLQQEEEQQLLLPILGSRVLGYLRSKVTIIRVVLSFQVFNCHF